MLHSAEKEDFCLTKIFPIRLGSSSCGHTTRYVIIGQECELSHQGTDADFDMIVQRYRDMNGKVDAFGVGGREGCSFGTNVMEASH